MVGLGCANARRGFCGQRVATEDGHCLLSCGSCTACRLAKASFEGYEGVKTYGHGLSDLPRENVRLSEQYGMPEALEAPSKSQS